MYIAYATPGIPIQDELDIQRYINQEKDQTIKELKAKLQMATREGSLPNEVKEL